MALVSPKAVEEFKDIYKKENGEELSDKEAWDSAQRLLNFFEVLMNISEREYLRKKRLKKEPKGFPLEAGQFYSCPICNRSFPGEQLWYDKYGFKCLDCQRNLNNGTIPKKLLKGNIPSDNWFTGWQLKDKFGIHASTLRKLVKEGKIKSIQLLNNKGCIYHEIFPVSENLKLFKSGNLKYLSHNT